MTRLVLAMSVLAVVVAGCTRAEGDVDARQARGKKTTEFCVVWSDIDALREPPLSDAGRLRRYAEAYLGALQALDPTLKVDKKPLSRARRDDLRTVRVEVDRFNDAVDDGAEPRRAMADLARGPFTAASDRLTRYWSSRC